MIYSHKANGYQEFDETVRRLELDGLPIFVLFSGGQDEHGVSWCPYCVTADPVVHAGLELLEDDVHFVHVNVGERLAWREPNSPFRTEPRLKLVWVPTLLNWRTSERVDSRHVSDAVQVNALLQRRAPDSDTA